MSHYALADGAEGLHFSAIYIICVAVGARHPRQCGWPVMFSCSPAVICSCVLVTLLYRGNPMCSDILTLVFVL